MLIKFIQIPAAIFLFSIVNVLATEALLKVNNLKSNVRIACYG